jgi:NADH dehydrogenase/NADH:ubiquinone oxidoreductase subunit G
MYTKEQVDEMLLQVEQEFEKTLESIAKNEEIETEELEESEDFETIDELYASMDKSEIEAHYDAIKKVMFGEAEKMAKEESAAHEAAESEEEEKKEHKKKKEEKEEMEKCGEMVAKKSEKDLVSENEELKKNLETLNDLVAKMFNKKAPTQKAITNASFIAKSEETETSGFNVSELSKSEITSKLKALDYGKLSKSDKDAINNFYLENGSVNKIKHLITK